ncbi:MAG TPA: branched-chain amino acid ABC transporter permease [Acetobacteraceae bacterium]|jgi:branched-chain amino acid transport system permease protein|nr:branched-chain amino acid ABC transporter permease [Acetobacteraceae bacterium]
MVLLFNISNGLIVGLFYALMALGLALILMLNNVVNFAHGGFMTLGAYVAFTVEQHFGFWAGLPVAPFVIGALGLFGERWLIRPLYKRPGHLYSLLLTFGFALILEDVSRSIWGAQGLPFAIPDALNSPLSDTYFFITGYNVFVVIVTAVAAGALFALLRFTRIGVRIRAGMTDLETVSALGVNIYGLRALNFGLGLFLAGLAGVMAAGRLGLDPTMGQGLILPAFVAIIVGGLGSLPGAILGGLLIGVAAGITSTYFASASDAVIYLIMGVVLIFMPRGLLGEEGIGE